MCLCGGQHRAHARPGEDLVLPLSTLRLFLVEPHLPLSRRLQQQEQAGRHVPGLVSTGDGGVACRCHCSLLATWGQQGQRTVREAQGQSAAVLQDPLTAPRPDLLSLSPSMQAFGSPCPPVSLPSRVLNICYIPGTVMWQGRRETWSPPSCPSPPGMRG